MSDDSKQFATVQARAALAGIGIEPSTDDQGRHVFIATHGLSAKRLATLAEADEWLDRVEAGLTCVTAGGSDE